MLIKLTNQTILYSTRLATVQEARSKTPVSVLAGQSMTPRPDTPSQYLASLMSVGTSSYSGRNQADEELRKTKNLILNDVRAVRVDSVHRMQSIQVCRVNLNPMNLRTVHIFKNRAYSSQFTPD